MNRLSAIDEKLGVFTKTLLLLLPCIVLLFPIKVSSYLLGMTTLVWLYLSIRERSVFKFRCDKFFSGLPIANYFVLLLGMALTSNFIMGIKTLETKIPLLILPLSLLSGHDLLKNTSKKTVLFVYSMGVLLVCAYVCMRILILSGQGQVGYSFKDLSGIINIHPGYFSLYIGFAILVLIIQFKSFQGHKRIFIGVALVFLFLFNLLLVARMPMIGLFVSILIYLLITRNYKIILLIVSVLPIFFFSVGYQNADWSHRILAPTRMLINGDFDQLQYFAYDRVQEFSCTIELLQKGTRLLTGFGTGDDNDALYSCYSAHGYDWILSQKYNAHNQYLQTVLQNGIIGGVLCFLLITAPLFSKKVSVKRDLDFMMFSCLFGIFSLTESTLEVQKGVVFFAFFYGILASYTEKRMFKDHGDATL